MKSKDALGYVLTALFAIALIACVQGRAAASCAGASMEAHLANTETSTFEKALFATAMYIELFRRTMLPPEQVSTPPHNWH